MVVQFIGTLAILVGTIVAYQQMNYIQQKDLGFEEEKLLVIDINSGTARQRFGVFKDELQKHPAISEVATSSRVPGEWKYINEVTLMPQGIRSDSLESLFFCFDELGLLLIFVLLLILFDIYFFISAVCLFFSRTDSVSDGL